MRFLRTQNTQPLRYKLFVTENEIGEEVKYEHYYCPVCNTVIYGERMYEETCHKCGQPLDWRRI